MSDYQPPNCRATYFQHLNLTEIDGFPTYATLKTLNTELKANAKSVPSDLGGGAHGHLGMAVTVPIYERISPGFPFLRPAQPVLPDLLGLTGPQISAARHIFSQEHNRFNTCNQVERTIIQQIAQAIDAEHLADMIDYETGAINGTIPEIIAELFEIFGQVSAAELAEAKKDVQSTTYDPRKPMSTIFTLIHDYAAMAEFCKTPETPEQLISIGLIIITNVLIFSSDVRKWHAKPAIEKTWPAFKTHFIKAQREIQKSQPAVTTDSLGYHQANAAATQEAAVNAITAKVIANLTPAEDIAEQQLAYSIQQTQGMMEMLTTLRDDNAKLQTSFTNLQTQVRQGRGGGGRGGDRGGGGRGRGRGGGRGGGRAFKYCWTHGKMGHESIDCNTKAEGHIDNATCTNMQGGSTFKCNGI
jgi:uncharacterized membrane protein YgcG